MRAAKRAGRAGGEWPRGAGDWPRDLRRMLFKRTLTITACSHSVKGDLSTPGQSWLHHLRFRVEAGRRP